MTIWRCNTIARDGVEEVVYENYLEVCKITWD